MSLVTDTLEVQSHPDPLTYLTSRLRWYWKTSIRSPLWLCLLVAILVRVFLALHTNPTIAGDEAVTGIQAENILRGAHPVYYYGQSYMGSLEAYILALFFAIAGSSVLVLRIGMTCISLVLVILTWNFGAALAQQARLTGKARTCFLTISTLIAALPPLYDTVLELRSFGGYIEAMIIMLWLLLSALRLTQRWGERASIRELTIRWMGIGFLLGLGLWIDPLIIYAVATILLWIGGFLAHQLLHPTDATPRSKIIKEACLIVAGIPTAVIGFAPAIDYGFHHHWENILYMVNSHSSVQGSKLHAISQVGDLYVRCIAPRVIGGTLSTEPFVTQGHPAILTPGLVINIICLSIAGGIILLTLFKPYPALVRIRQLTLLPLLFFMCTSIIYCVSSISTASVYAGCGSWDLTGRYAAPLVITLPFFLAGIATFLWSWKQHTTNPQEILPAPTHGRNTTVVRLFMLAILVLYFTTQLYPYIISSQHNTFQTSGCIPAPSDDTAIIAYLKQQQISYALATAWIGDPLTFKTASSILVTEPKSRIPGNSNIVLHAKHYALIMFAQQKNPDPPILKALAANHYSYQVKRFPTVPGWDVMVITTPTKNVSPFDPAFKAVLQPLHDLCVTS